MRIGLTGGIAAGKSTVAARMKEDGAYVIDYDALAREVVKPHAPALERIAQEFGPDALNADGTLDRAWLARHVFATDADPHALERLNAIEHPYIYRAAEEQERQFLREYEQCANGRDKARQLVVVHDIPLLADVFNTIPFHFDHIVTVEADEATRVRRMMETRAMSEQQALDRIAHQASDQRRRAISDTFIDASQPMDAMLEQVDRIMAPWLGRQTD